MNAISGLQLPQLSPGLMQSGANAPGSNSAFKEMLVDAIKEVNTMQQDADKLVETWATGGDVNTAEVLTAVQKADLTFRMMMQVRNKMVQAFDELRNIRI
jgi:flagellar hook-basal body complex protein FliE